MEAVSWTRIGAMLTETAVPFPDRK